MELQLAGAVLDYVSVSQTPYMLKFRNPFAIANFINHPPPGRTIFFCFFFFFNFLRNW
jgi:hypothetical protein